MSDLETFLDQNSAPTARPGLSNRILAAAKNAAPANDTSTSRPWWSVAGVAAMAIMATIFILRPVSEPDIEWARIAETSGFSDLYDWVEGDDG